MNKLFLSIKILSLFGILLAVYLLFEMWINTSLSVCNINSTVNCNAIINGPVSKVFGVPTALIGLIGYVIILFSSILKMKKTILTAVIFGLIFCMWIAYQELFLLHVICPVCILCQFTMLTIFIISLIIINKDIKNKN